MSFSGSFMISFSDNLPVFDNDGPHHGIGRGEALTFSGEIKRHLHKTFIFCICQNATGDPTPDECEWLRIHPDQCPSINGLFAQSTRGGQVSALCLKNNPQNINYMPVVIFFTCLDIEQKS
jgi:hypothetical protein